MSESNENPMSADLPNSANLASPQHRLGGYIVDQLLALVTLYVGWFIWSLIAWRSGQTPGKRLVKTRVYDTTTGKPASWKLMALRQIVVPLSVALFFELLIGINGAQNVGTGQIISLALFSTFALDFLWIFRGGERRRLLDHVCKTVVLNEAA
jgi:uncharacterized RDD family membrane protein YckC